MKKILLLTIFGIGLVNLTMQVQAQNREMPWAVGFNFAWIDAQGGIKSPMFKRKDNWNQAAQISVAKFINPSLNVYASTAIAEISKPNTRFDKNISFFNLDLGAQYHAANGYLLKENHWFDPFIFVGAGVNTLRSQNKFFYNGGLGVNFWVKDFFAITAQTSYNGVNNFKDLDRYWNHAIGIKFRIGDVFDTDGDGIIDKFDECPEVKGPEALKGCPDTDSDGIVDKDDACPDKFGVPEFKGCPDTDSDGIADSEDECPEVRGTPALKGCPDADNDGIADKNDQCPFQKGIPELKGCPDTDSDGIADKDDLCPTQKGLAEFKGCPDTDGDGIPDHEDQCPMQKGTRARNGCPEPVIPKEKEKEVEDVLSKVAHRIQFETGSAKITQESYPELDKALSIMRQYPNAKFIIEGHTDDVGTPERNKVLSQERADAVKAYFVSKGIEESRLRAIGYGQDRPVVPNNSEANRAINRRVEMFLDKDR
ncbi:MAG: OmpA family protein [Microscillaceae bacterium]|nr:OmpA family protein [Microscillaceae bacterium]MDW8461745.1 OmpA family protein [Cytophagales bacterium]